jgi:hypothetical protein
LFVAPFVQYGVVLFCFAILCTIALRLLSTRGSTVRLSRAVIASACLAAGGLMSFFLTLRYQFHAGGKQWYLANNSDALVISGPPDQHIAYYERSVEVGYHSSAK